MREIKFRVWDKKTKEMLSWGVCNNFDGRYCATIDGKVYNTWELGYFLQYPKRFVVMQYTSLKDIEGRDIYELDIVLASIYDILTNMSVLRRVVVVWKKSQWWIYGDDGISTSLPRTFSFVAGTPEIVGNVFENPELMEKYRLGKAVKEYLNPNKIKKKTKWREHF